MTDTNKPTGQSRRPRPAAPTTPDPVEIAMEIAASGQTPGDAALEVLRINAALMREQIDVAREEANLSREQIGLARNERFRNRIKAVRDIAIAVVVLLLAAGVIGFVWNARQASGLVIQPLSTPPDLAQRGLDSRAVSSQLLDRLNRLQAETDSIRAANTYANNWQGDVSVEIPSTGVSIGELDHWLRGTLGRETVISGEVTRAGESLSMKVRTPAGGGRTIVSPTGDLDALVQGAAEAIYEMTQPYRYAIYLRGAGRRDEGLAVLRKLAASGAPLDRAYANLGLGVDLDRQGYFDQGMVRYRRALEIDPDFAPAENNLAAIYDMVGDTERALASSNRLVRILNGPGRRVLQPGPAEVTEIVNRAFIADYQGDAAAAADLVGTLAGKQEYAGIVQAAPLHQASLLVAAHDLGRARRVLVDVGVASAVQSYRITGVYYDLSIPTADLLIARELWPQALAELQAWEGLVSRPDHVAQIPIVIWPRMAEVMARMGRLDEAVALVGRTPTDCYPCLTARARIAELAGDRPAADRWSAEARRQGPSLPFAFAERGQMLMARGDVAGAIDFYELAIERGPRWADPQKYWGDALMARGDAAGAIRKYRAAADRAPQWGALHLAWGRALEAQGRRDQAREKYEEAARLDLSATDRAEVVRRLGVRPG
ncbi:tetratricopeptide repeat protein [Brevundimonas sp.]|uniref:tetratricopeptide repeat protein n=1 Tax=Brevundimonas sp. TaxID=1871086 RepID=UPI00261F26FA|nr:tetratricopeptide repeat protein [Brevundimonas sp.]